ncbi:hypothetical protein LUZ60_013084 [Juncus effusus]|nr:hypothetical protein LUZ60_013084 [Juncus effusus]
MASSSRLFLFATLLLLSSSSIATDSKVSVDLYYESLCPYSADFIVNYLAKTFHNGLISIVHLDLIPYGNAHHGEDECLLNVMQACAMNVWPDLNVHFAFINCLETVAINETHQDPYSEWGKCFSINETSKLDPKPVLDCSTNGTGHQLHLENGKRTDALNPPLEGVPWILINGKPLESEYDEFQVAVCKAYKGNNRPKVCDDHKNISNISEEKKLRNGVGVSYHSKISLPDHAMKKEMVD